MLHVGERVHPTPPGSFEQGARNPTGSVRRSWIDGHVSTYHLVFLFFFLLYIGFINIVSNLTQHWCAWDHAACMCIGPPRTDWHVPMCAGVKSGYLPYILAFNIHLTAL